MAREFDWPTEDVVREEQYKLGKNISKSIEKHSNGLLYVEDKIWVPDDAAELQLQILVAGHCRIKGHRGLDSTYHTILKEFLWKGLKEDIKDFMRKCMHCILSRVGQKVPRPLSSTAHASHPNQMLHFDYLYMGSGVGGLKYVLVLNENFSSYKWL